MSKLKFAFSVLIGLLIFWSCSKDSETPIVIESELGCVDETLFQITEIPYLTTKAALLDAIEVNANYTLELFASDMVTVVSSVETNHVLGVLKGENVVKTYKLYKQELEGENVVNGTPTRTEIQILCKDIFSTKAIAKTLYFNAIKDSIYDIYAYNGDSAHGYGYITITDTDNVYFQDESSGTNAGSGCQGDPCSDAHKYTFTSQITGEIYIEIYGEKTRGVLTPGFPLHPFVSIWVKKE